MCFVSRKRLNRLESSLTELTNIVKNREYQALKADSEELKTVQELLEHVQIKVDEVKTVLDQDTMEEVVVVKYSVPSVTIRFDDNGDPVKDELFYAINALNLISLDDMAKIRRHLNDQKIKKS